MKYIVAIIIIIIVVYGFFFSLINIGDYGSGGIIMTGLFGYALYKIGRLIAEGYKGDNKTSSHSSGNRAYSSRSTYTSNITSSVDEEIDEMIMMDMMDGDLDGKFDISDKD